MADPEVLTPDATPHHLNSSDATMGQPMVTRVMARKHELEAVLAALPEADLRARGDIELALTTIDSLLTGDLTNVPAVVVKDMNSWLEHNKYLGESAGAATEPATDAVADTVAEETESEGDVDRAVGPASEDDTAAGSKS